MGSAMPNVLDEREKVFLDTRRRRLMGKFFFRFEGKRFDELAGGKMEKEFPSPKMTSMRCEQ